MIDAKISLDAVSPCLHEVGIDCFGIVRLADCRITRGYLLSRAGLSSDMGSVLMMALPYLAVDDGPVNISRYAVPCDYHLVAETLSARLIARLTLLYPGARFAAFADHSPIDERHAAALAGLGVLGDHGLLITERYASYIFLCEIITDLPTDAVAEEIGYCAHCGACRSACPVGLDADRCLSALTQKKGKLTDAETALLRRYALVWGCDRCQEACPHTTRARAAGGAVHRHTRISDRSGSLSDGRRGCVDG